MDGIPFTGSITTLGSLANRLPRLDRVTPRPRATYRETELMADNSLSWPQTVEWREAEQGVLKRLWELAQIGHNERNVIENFVQIGIGQAFPAGTGMIPVNGQTGRSYIQG